MTPPAAGVVAPAAGVVTRGVVVAPATPVAVPAPVAVSVCWPELGGAAVPPH